MASWDEKDDEDDRRDHDGNRGIVNDYFQIESSRGVSTPEALDRVWITGLDNPAFCPGCGLQFAADGLYRVFDYHSDYNNHRDRFAKCLHCGTSCKGADPRGAGLLMKGGLTLEELGHIIDAPNWHCGPSARREEMGIGPERARHEHIVPKDRWFVETGGHRRGPPEEGGKPRKVFFAFYSSYRLMRPSWVRQGLEPPPRITQLSGRGATSVRVAKWTIEAISDLVTADGLTDKERHGLEALIRRL
jgi:hypothetical protein